MVEYKIKLNGVDNIKEFIKDMQVYDVTMELTSLDGKYECNAKSILGIFSLDLSNAVLLKVYCVNIDILAAIKKDIEKYEV